MPHLKNLFRGLLALCLLPYAPAAFASAYDAHPKLVVILVIDQFRADYLDRYRADFKGRGFRMFLDRGAYFEDCYYNYANTKTAPGHATLATGAYTDGHGISSNAWWDLSRNQSRPVTAVEDPRYHLVGASGNSAPGASPWNLRASTIGDSLRLGTNGQAKVFSISLKDRAAILPGGFTANAAYWVDSASGAFLSSSYYLSALPDWVTAFNTSGRIAQAKVEANAPDAGSFLSQVGPTPAANSYELDFARALITAEQLGHDPVTDMLLISLSAPDLLGHQVGPDSPEERQMVDSLDQQLDGFFSWLDQNVPGGLANVWLALSADHGVAPVPAQAVSLGLPAATIDLPRFVASLNDAMNAKFSPGEKVKYLLSHQELPYLSLNRPSFEVAGINEQEAEEAVREAAPDALRDQEAKNQGGQDAAAASPASPAAANPGAATAQSPPSQIPPNPAPPVSGAGSSDQTAGPAAGQAPASGANPTVPEPVAPPAPVRAPPPAIILHTYTREQLAAGQMPPSEWGLLLSHSYSPNGGWYVMVIPEAFQMQALRRGTTHFSPWSYDRHVPLGFYGLPFTPGIYHGRVEPVDLAATLASLLGLTQPSAAIGHVLTQAIRIPPPIPEPRPAHRHASSAAGARRKEP
jgi:predicted AlkP superfamily pyrophosphatase or phosphodiesterase